MFPYNLIVLLSLIINAYSVNNALKPEELVGGYSAYPANHKHHVAIIGKYNYSDYRHLVCSGAILGDFFVLSAAHCFVKGFYILKKITFFVLVGSVEITSHIPSKEYEIETIFLAGYSYEYYSNDLAVCKLKESLRLDKNRHLATLRVPYPNETYPKTATVAGYGNKIHNPRRKWVHSIKLHRLNRHTGMNLTYAFVKLSSDEECKQSHRHIKPLINMCGLIKSDYRHKQRGLCMGDGGAPLDKDGKVLGIALKNNEECDDTEKGCVYVKVPFYKDFINAVISGQLENSITTALIFPNRLHIPYYTTTIH